ncbi:MAG: galactokinase, partial [Selenomonas bovis]|nr:galactokinase [Selenomonas bovis]
MEKEFLAGMAKVFEEKFGTQAERRYFSPGRVNLIGEHTDYNGGHVFPCAISLGTYALVRDRADAMTRVYSMNLADKGVIEFSMSGLVYDAAKDWANYFMGVVDVFEKAGYKASHGFDIVINGTLPGGAGLSSSASL